MSAFVRAMSGEYVNLELVPRILIVADEEKDRWRIVAKNLGDDPVLEVLASGLERDHAFSLLRTLAVQANHGYVEPVPAPIQTGERVIRGTRFGKPKVTR